MFCFTIISLKLPVHKPQVLPTSNSTYGTIEDTIEGSKIPEPESKSKSFDIVGLVFLLTAIVSLLCFVQLAEAHETQNQSIVLMILGAIFLTCIIIFCLNEAYWTQEPMLPLSLLYISKLGLNYSAQFFIGVASYAVTNPRPLSHVHLS